MNELWLLVAPSLTNTFLHILPTYLPNAPRETFTTFPYSISIPSPSIFGHQSSQNVRNPPQSSRKHGSVRTIQNPNTMQKVMEALPIHPALNLAVNTQTGHHILSPKEELTNKETSGIFASNHVAPASVRAIRVNFFAVSNGPKC